MARKFNITGLCVHHLHYMVDISKKVEKILQLIDESYYFTINRPRQYGKTTILTALATALQKKNEYICIDISFEGLGEGSYQTVEVFIEQFIELLKREFSRLSNPVFQNFIEHHESVSDFNKLSIFITKLIELSPSNVVLLIDEVDKSMNNQLFLDFLGMLRNKYLDRAKGKDRTFHSVILAGVHDVKTMKLKINPKTEFKYNSTWNIAVDFKVDLSFNPDEIATMLSDYSLNKKIEMDIKTISERIYHYTSGYPFLVSRICKEIDEEILPVKKIKTWEINDVENAVREIVKERNTNFESLVKYIEDYPELNEYLENIILAHKKYIYNSLNPTMYLGEIHGMFSKRNDKLVISNKIYEEVITNYILSKLEAKEDITNDVVQSSYIKPTGRLNIEKVLFKFQEVIKEKYSKSDVLKSDEFLEKDLRLLFLVFLKPIINGIGFSFKEVETSEEKRLDIVILFSDEKFIVELKIWRGLEYHTEGITRLKDYMRRESAQKGYMLIMDKTRNKEFTSNMEEDILMVWI
jgi:hypothetical protein